ncbi:MAG: Glycosyl transferase family 2 [Nitrospira sp.]|nr:MAG: Glycosyl transferase family 2 [Nitrospira sp.]
MSGVGAATISIVTPTMNMERWLPLTIESVVSNMRQGDEYFVIDGGSTDTSAAIIKRYERHLAGWVSEPDKGYADALAKGFARATGDIFCWINAGDVLLPGALDAARAELANTDADMIFGDDFYIDEDHRVIFFSRGYVKNLQQAMLYGGWTPLQDACFWRRELYEKIGGMNRDLKYAADFELFLRMALHGTCRYVPLAFSAFRRHAGQKSISGSEAYRNERAEVRRRELVSAVGASLWKSLRLLWSFLTIRWRVYVMQRQWRRADLVGRQVNELRCGQYWPPAGTV